VNERIDATREISINCSDNCFTVVTTLQIYSETVYSPAADIHGARCHNPA